MTVSRTSLPCISLWQPWALAWLLSYPDEKRFETRPRYWGVRGPLLVHAAKKRDGDVADALADEEIISRLTVHGIKPEDLAFGAIIGMVNMVGCCQMSRMPAPSRLEDIWGNWSPERYALERGTDPVIFEKPVPYCGKQGLFMVSLDMVPEVQQ